MYGNGAQQREAGIGISGAALEQATAPIEQFGSIQDSTLKQLYEIHSGLDHLLAKIRGPQPQAGASEKTSERHLMATAYEIRGLANEISSQVAELHRVIGNDK